MEQGASGLVVPLGVPLNGAGVTGLHFNCTFTGFDGSNGMTPTMVYRTFDSGDTSRPNAWQSGSAQTEVTSDTRKAFNLSTTTTDRLLIQAGLKYDSDAAANGAVDVLVAAKT